MALTKQGGRRRRIFPREGALFCLILFSLTNTIVLRFLAPVQTSEGIVAVPTPVEARKTTAENNNYATNVGSTSVLSPPPQGTCGQIYLWDAGKAGSTTLFFTLTRGPGGLSNLDGTHNPGPVRDIMIGKEICTPGPSWSKWVSATGRNSVICKIQQQQRHGNAGNNKLTMQQTHILNGCPRHTSEGHAKSIMDLDGSQYTKFLMPIRDPVERLVSFMVDNSVRLGGRFNVEQKAKRLAVQTGPVRGLEGSLSYQGLALQSLLKHVHHPSQILIIPMESMAIDMQGVIDSVMDHVGGARWEKNATQDHQMNKGDRKSYATLKNDTRDALREKFRDDVILLERLVGRRFSWSSWAYGGGNDGAKSDSAGKRIDWLTTVPRGI